MIKTRQSIRRLLIVGSTLLFPVTMLYLSPGIVFRGARTGVLSGSYITFIGLFLSSMFLGRMFCGWICPGGGFSEVGFTVNKKEFKNIKLNYVKYVVWVVWLIAIVFVAIFIGGGYKKIDPLLGTKNGFSIHSFSLVLAYYVVIGFILVSSLIIGRRGFCHTFCWMAPFMIIGRKIALNFKFKVVALKSEKESCVSCKRCSNNCPMTLPVDEMVCTEDMESSECILCGVCIDECPYGVINYKNRRTS